MENRRRISAISILSGRKRTPALIADVAADIEIDRRVTLNKLARAHGVSKRTINLTLRHDLNLTKKSARWVPKLLTEEMKKERVRTSELFLAMVRRRTMLLLDNIVTMEESAVSNLCSGYQRDSLGL